MDDSEATSLEQIRAFLAGSGGVHFAGQHRDEVYGWTEGTLVHHQYSVLGRPENDGRTNVWYAVLEAIPELRVAFVPVAYEHERLAAEMRAERLPEEFVETVLTGWWTTCLEILPAKERRAGRY